MDIADGRLRGRSVARATAAAAKAAAAGAAPAAICCRKQLVTATAEVMGLLVARVSGIRKETRASSCRHEADAMGFCPLETTLGLVGLRGMQVIRSREL